MSIRAFVTFSSLVLMAWLALAFLHTPSLRGGADPLTPEAEPASVQEAKEPGDLTVSVSPSGVAPD